MSTFLCHFSLNRMSVRLFQRISGALLRDVTRGMRKKGGGRGGPKPLSALFMPAPIEVNSNPDVINVGEELGEKIDKGALLSALIKFKSLPEIAQLAAENGLDSGLFNRAFVSFKKHCLESASLDVDFHIVCSDLLRGSGHVADMFPYFLSHAKKIFPHLECMEELQKISDLRLPANWYPEARSLERKFIFHAGPTNSGKTYNAMEAFVNAKSGVYCGPLKMLAVEVFQKTNAKGTSCDLITGENRECPQGEDTPSDHIACTVEMASTKQIVDVAVIDEIQMIKDPQRGWAWTRALLGIPAKEIHLCGEDAAITLVEEILMSVGESLKVNRYKRLTPLVIENQALISLTNLQPGDCVVCFSKKDIYNVSLTIEKMGREYAVIYGSLPPGTKSLQAEKFNDPKHPCKILVATDAIGMGLNLSIRRVIFYSVIKPSLNDKGQAEKDIISVSHALQIAGRAGRFGTVWAGGRVTTMKSQDLEILRGLLAEKPDTIVKAGLHPTADQIELFAYHLPHATLSNLIDIFCSLSQVDNSQYFICDVESLKFLADMIQHVPLSLRARYVFCCAPLSAKMPFVCTNFLKYAKRYSANEPVTLRWLHRTIGWPLNRPQNIGELIHLEAVFDVIDLYLWLSYRFPDIFPDQQEVREWQKEIDVLIQEGLMSFTQLIRNADNDQNQTVDQTRSAQHVKKSRLTDTLIAKGLISKEQLEQLQKEWMEKGSKK